VPTFGINSTRAISAAVRCQKKNTHYPSAPQEDVGEVADVGGLEVEEIEEGGVVHGGHGPCRGGSRGIGGEAVCEGGSGRMPGCSGGRGVGRMPGEKGLVAGRSLGVHDVPGGAAREGPAYLLELLDAEASFGRRCEF
jgi:hypothetical protein